MKKTDKNGEIELLRFVFALIIVIRHSDSLLGDSYPLAGGAFAVEFFFLVSGFLMARSVEKSGPSMTIGRDTLLFLKRKVYGVLPETLVAFLIAFVFQHCVRHSSFVTLVDSAMASVWEITFLNMSGLGQGIVNGVTWYISSMLISMLVLYPLLRNHRDVTIHILMPFAIVIILGWLYQNGSLLAPRKWHGWAYRGTIRAFAEISLGAILYYLTQRFQRIPFNRFAKAVLTILKYAGFAVILIYMRNRSHPKWDFTLLLVMAACIGIIFSGQALDTGLYQNRFCSFLGKFSLPLYLSHDFYSRNLGYILPETLSRAELFFVYVCVSFFTAAVVMLVSGFFRKNSQWFQTRIRRIFLSGGGEPVA